MHRLPTRTLVVAAAGMTAFLGLLPLAGCGGAGSGGSHGTSVASRAKGTVSVSLQWPAVTRVIPLSAQSVTVKIVRTPASVVAVPPQVLTRPNPTQAVVSTANFTNLEVGSYTVTVTAYPNPDGSGTAQATATTQVTVNPGNNTVTLTMDATVKRLTLVQASNGLTNFRIGKGQIRQLIATAFDNATVGSGNVVLTSRAVNGSNVSSIVWTSSNPAAASVDQNGVLTAVGPGTAIITAQYIEPNLTAGQQGTGASATSTVTVVGVGLAQSAWPKFHGDLQNTGRALTGASTTGNAHTFRLPGGTSVEFSSPALFFNPDGSTNVYVGALDGYLYAFRDSGGTLTLRWKFQTSGAIGSSPAIGPDGTVYFGSDDSNVYAVDAGGKQLWKQPTGGTVHGSPTISSTGVVYAGSYDGNVYAFDQVNGTPLAVTPVQMGNGVPGGVQGSPALSPDGKTLYVGSFDHNLYAFDLVEGSSFSVTQKWVFSATDVIYSSSPSVTPDGSTIYIGSLDGKLYAVNADGSLKWTFDANAPIYSSPAIGADGTVYVASFDNFSGSNINSVYALNSATGVVSKQSPVFAAGITSSPAIGSDGVVYVGCYDNNIYGIDFSAAGVNAPLKWTVTTGGQIDSSPALGADGTVYIGGFDGIVYAVK